MAFLLQKLNELRARQGGSLIQVSSFASLSESTGLKVHFADPHGEASARVGAIVSSDQASLVERYLEEIGLTAR